jgi:hypothetical protein
MLDRVYRMCMRTLFLVKRQIWITTAAQMRYMICLMGKREIWERHIERLRLGTRLMGV